MQVKMVELNNDKEEEEESDDVQLIYPFKSESTTQHCCSNLVSLFWKYFLVLKL